MMMMFVLIIFSVLVISSASKLRNCDDCIEINDCHAVEYLMNNVRSKSATMLQKAFCGMGRNGTPKVCCSDFSSDAQLQPNNKPELSDNGDAIEHHPNLHLLPATCGKIEAIRILGGRNPTQHEFPWLALIAHRDGRALKFYCAGTLINAKYVLTTAHCIKGQVIIGVRVGCYDMSKTLDCNEEGEYRQFTPKYQDIAVAYAIIHPDFIQGPTLLNNIGLLRLKNPIDFSLKNVDAICLPVSQNLRARDIFGNFATIAGWNKMRSDILLRTNVPILSPEECRYYYDRNEKRGTSSNPLNNTLCAGSFTHDSCVGDAGGPLMIEDVSKDSYRFIQYGILSYGTICRDAPEVYTDVRKFMKWILDTIES